MIATPAQVTRKPLPALLAVTLVGIATTGCGTPKPNPGDCPEGCGKLTEADGGFAVMPDGGPYCLC